ncbi:hypothetical protein [Heyndrickxia camelliae]|uniref:Uncharacterized protein n=1 Tax=Heyndrickxia camelliae TaxID=1707093 RepID=A0A2N3LFX1_9BACI|nr:hypothetical protein [Heyndrickxia camelliae]PKR83530.1 hypothetical protein CWO92_18365 [Heyndrickxia camelliae]
MNKKLYNFIELLSSREFKAGVVAETVNLGVLNYKLWFNPKTFVLEYKDYPQESVQIICSGHKDYENIPQEDNGELLFRILN